MPEPRALKSIWRIDKWVPEVIANHAHDVLAPLWIPLAMLAVAIRYKNVNWPRQVRRYIVGQDVLDVGCGRSLYSIGFLFAGARSYTGVDPRLKLDSALLKDSSGLHGRPTRSPWTPREIMTRVENVLYIQGTTRDLPPGSMFGVLAMHNVTEHLEDLDGAFAGFAKLVRPGGRIVFRHPSFHAWGGHHMVPRTVDEIVEGDPEQQKYRDWGHLSPRNDWPAKIRTGQNRVRLKDLRAIVDRHFRIEIWHAEFSSEREGALRLTPEILARHPDYKREELLTQSVICVARRSAE